jgi:cytidine deaminase
VTSKVKSEDLLAAALAVRVRAHVPYSGFAVGAAIRTGGGRIFAGCNVENASYPEGICAEAGAIAAMVAAGDREIVEVLTVADADGGEVVTCCGGCRQKLREFAAADVVVHAADPNGVRATFTVGGLLPQSFGPGQLGAPDPERPSATADGTGLAGDVESSSATPTSP